MNSIVSKSIVFLADTVEGGAGRAAYSLFDALRARGLPVYLWYYYGSVSDEYNTVCLDGRRHRPPFERVLKNFNRHFADVLMTKRHANKLKKMLNSFSPDLLHIHNIHGCGLKNPSQWQSLFANIPFVWTMHDTCAFSGICYPQNNFVIPKVIFSFWENCKGGIAVAPSRWMCRQFKNLYTAVPIIHIPLGIKPLSTKHVSVLECRKLLGLNPNATWVGFCGGSDPRKGGDLLLEASKILTEKKDVRLLSWGRSLKMQSNGFKEIRELGTTDDSEEMALRYGACDFYACPSRADNFPLVVLESLSVGTPVWASTEGGTSETILEGTNGWSYRLNLDSMRDSLLNVVNNVDFENMRAQTRCSWEATYTKSHEVENIVNLYHQRLIKSK